jgi:hypothetical protein
MPPGGQRNAYPAISSIRRPTTPDDPFRPSGNRDHNWARRRKQTPERSGNAISKPRETKGTPRLVLT